MTIRVTKLMLAGVVAMMAAAVPAAAVMPAVAAELTAVAGPQPDRAAELRAQAEALFSQPKQWRKAARLLERSAQLRDAADAEGYACLVLAGGLWAAVGEYETAQQVYSRAAAHAQARGDVVEAAHALINAAHAAAENRNVADAQAFIDRATLLAASPLLSTQQVEEITRRITT
jgi:tetratricopeptide (TPR) repeat protein